MGGAGTFSLGSTHADLFSAIAPVCGYVQDNVDRATLVDKPMWVAHGKTDEVIPPSQSEKFVEMVKKEGGNRIELHIVEGKAPDGDPHLVGHDSWTETYSDPAFWAWAFAQTRK